MLETWSYLSASECRATHLGLVPRSDAATARHRSPGAQGIYLLSRAVAELTGNANSKAVRELEAFARTRPTLSCTYRSNGLRVRASLAAPSPPTSSLSPPHDLAEKLLPSIAATNKLLTTFRLTPGSARGSGFLFVACMLVY